MLSTTYKKLKLNLKNILSFGLITPFFRIVLNSNEF